MAQETYDWSIDYADENSGTTTTFTSVTGETVDVTVSQPDPDGYYRNNRDGFETNSTMGGDSTGYFEMGVNYPTSSDTLTTTISFANNTESGANSVTDPSFTLYDVDGTTNASFQDQVTVLAFDADGNPLTVTLTPVNSSVVTVSGNTVTAVPGAGSGPSGSVAASSTEGNVQVSISGEVSSIQIIYGNGPLSAANPANQAIGISDVTFDLIPPVVCFVRGTLIRTIHGDCPVEQLRAGDLVITADRGAQPVRWVGKRSVAGHGHNAPVQFGTGAIGNTRPLIVSPCHRVVMGGAMPELLTGHAELLGAAKNLVNGRDITFARCASVDYFHFLFDRHEIVFAEGAPCESLFAGALTYDVMLRSDETEMLQDIEPWQTTPMEIARPCLRSFECALLR